MKRNEKFHTQIHNEYIPTIEQAYKMIETWLKLKHSQSCPNIKGVTIQEALDSIDKQKIDEAELDDLMMAQEVKHIGRNGIRFLKSDYFDDALYGIREKVIIKYSLFDLSYIKIYSIKGEYLCKANRVTSTHPFANYFGDIKDIEDYKQKITKQHKLRNKTLKAVKEHFGANDIELFEKELSENILVEDNKVIEVKNDKKEEKAKPKKVETIPKLRPIFKNNIERYEWHMKNGCRSQTDRNWFKEFKSTDEYKEYYA